MRHEVISDLVRGAVVQYALSSHIHTRCALDFARRGEPIPERFLPGRYLDDWKRKNPGRAHIPATFTEKDFSRNDLLCFTVAEELHPALNRHTRTFVMNRKKP